MSKYYLNAGQIINYYFLTIYHLYFFMLLSVQELAKLK